MSIAEKFLTMEYGPALEDPKDALLWLDGHHRHFVHFINGEWREPVEGVFFDTTNPATGEKIATVAQGSDRRCGCRGSGRAKYFSEMAIS